jgi:hypothetical protein
VPEGAEDPFERAEGSPGGVPASPLPDETRLARTVEEITLADFRGERVVLR